MSYQFGLTLAMSSRKNALNSEHAKFLCNWLLVFSNGKTCPVYRLANSIMVNEPVNSTLALDAINTLQSQHTGSWNGARQLILANCLAGLILGNDPSLVIGKTVEFIAFHENKLVN